ncbi:MAG: hypothetical protein H6974_06820 [Gammaproteobacteria bacterium]|nr:hypothetical protein [Gammaproteobacteria bacterium]MCP5196484.1 hypothetical protein [Gammaproteobacteria bacterium]
MTDLESNLHFPTTTGPILTAPPTDRHWLFWAGLILLALSLVIHGALWYRWRQGAVDRQDIAQIRLELKTLQTWQADAQQGFLLKADLKPLFQDLEPLKKTVERCQSDNAQLKEEMQRLQTQKVDKAWIEQQLQDYKMQSVKQLQRQDQRNPKVDW